MSAESAIEIYIEDKYLDSELEAAETFFNEGKIYQSACNINLARQLLSMYNDPDSSVRKCALSLSQDQRDKHNRRLNEYREKYSRLLYSVMEKL